MPHNSRLASLCVALAACIGPLASADTVVKRSGERLSGQIVAESDADITLQSSVGAIVMRQRIVRGEITAIEKTAVAENRYSRIPIRGEIGTEVKAEWIAKACDQAAALDATYLVFEFDSPGGSIAEMEKIITVVRKQTRFHTVALIKKALSAAAIIAISCDTIVVEPGSSIGAAVPWRFGPKGTPEDVEAKFLSAFRAYSKATADQAHHSPLLAAGMMDMNLVASPSKKLAAGLPEICEGVSADGTPVKRAGEILCLSASEALNCGLAAGTATDIVGVQAVLKAKDWGSVGDTAAALMEAQARAQTASSAARQQKASANSEHSQLEALLIKTNSRLNELAKSKEEATARLKALPSQQNAEISKINPQLPLVERDTRMVEIRNHYKVLVVEAQEAIIEADVETNGLQKLRGSIRMKLGF